MVSPAHVPVERFALFCPEPFANESGLFSRYVHDPQALTMDHCPLKPALTTAMDNTLAIREQARLGSRRMVIWPIYAYSKQFHGGDPATLGCLVLLWRAGGVSRDVWAPSIIDPFRRLAQSWHLVWTGREPPQ
jgi:hypothetical protein